MTEQFYFETVKTENRSNHPGRLRALLTKRQAQNEARKQREIEVKKRTVTRLRTMLASIEQEIANLDLSIGSELALSRVRKPSHFAYPISVSMMQARRDNLTATVAALSDRLEP
jgi:hypothetical protein